MKRLLKKALRKAGLMKGSPQAPAFQNIPDAQFYTPLFSPWLGYGEFGRLFEMCRGYTLVSADRCHVLYSLASQVMKLQGDFYECGVYKGGTAILLAELIASKATSPKKLHLFDTFHGMPDTDLNVDWHRRGDFADTDLDSVRARVGRESIAEFHQGFIPTTFAGHENARIAFVHVDVDIYQSVIDCCQFIMPRLVPGGFLVFDDYGFPSCPGARKAVDEFFEKRPETPLILPTGQAVVFSMNGAECVPDQGLLHQ